MLEIESQTNELLAKLLAAENIYVRFDSQIAGLAAFDLKSRVLHISTLNDEMQKYMPALLVHEVGHALYTNLPEDTPPEELFNNCNFLKNVWNAIEDGYVDRKTGKKYPGIKSNRTELFNEIFNKIDEEKSKVIHILNLLTANCKGFPIGKFFEWPDYVTSEHRDLFNQAIFVNEPELMARISFSGLVKDAIASYGDGDGGGLDGDVMFGDGDSIGHSEGQENQSGSNKNKLSDQQLDDLLEKNKSKIFNDDNLQKKLKDEDEFKNNNQKLKGNVWEESNIGSVKIPSQKEIEELSEIYDIFQFRNSDREVYTDYGYPKFLDIHPVFTELKKNFNEVNKNAKVTSQKFFGGFIKQVHARNYVLTSFRKTGALDATRASLFQIQDDIFKNRNIQQDQQNHAYVVMLDWSASMTPSLGALVHRAMELTHFANLAGVELEIWLYTDSGGKQTRLNKTLTDLTPAEQQRYSGVLFRQPSFIKILNTKKHKHELNDRLLNLFISSHLAISKLFKLSKLQERPYSEKNIVNHCWRSIVDEAYHYENLFNTVGSSRNKLINNFKVIKQKISQQYEILSPAQREYMYRNISTITQMSGTTIFEAVSFAGKQIENISAEIKNIILLTDGADSPFNGIIGNFSFSFTHSGKTDKIIFGITPSLPSNLLSKIYAGEKTLSYEGSKVSPELVKDLLDFKQVAASLIKNKLTRQRIDINMIGWNLDIGHEKEFEKIFGKKPVNITSELRKSSLRRYVQMENPFITHITKSLLGQST